MPDSYCVPGTSSSPVIMPTLSIPAPAPTRSSSWISGRCQPTTVALILVLCFISAVEAGPGGCLACTNRTQAAEFRVEKLKQQLLASLGLKAPINVPRDAIPPQSIIDRIQRQALLEDERSEAVERTYVFAQESKQFAGDAEYPTLSFAASPVTRSKTITHIKLQVFLQKRATASDGQTVEIRVIERFMNGSLGDAVATHIAKVSQHRSKYASVSIPVEDVTRWWEDEESGSPKYAGVYIQAELEGKSLVALPGVTDEEGTYLEVNHKEVKREKRAVATCSPQQKEAGCCLYDLTVNFDDAGWDFVLAPRFYNAYICAGDCTNNRLDMNRYLHTKMTEVGRTRLSTSMCCHPSEYDPINIIYVNENKEVVLSKVAGMIARRCACA